MTSMPAGAWKAAGTWHLPWEVLCSYTRKLVCGENRKGETAIKKAKREN